MMNRLKIMFARIVIFFFNRLFTILNKVTKGYYRAKDHYYTMTFFKKLFKNYPVTMKYSNPLVPHRKTNFKINLADNSSQHYFNSKGRYEFEWVSLIHKILPYYECFIDIGANLGVYTVNIAQANPSKKVIAIEPLNSNYKILEENIMINNLSNCEYMRKAVSNCEGTLKFYINPIHDGGGSLIERNYYRTGNIIFDAKKYQEKHKDLEYYEEVDSISIDKILTTKSIMKIDVEGAELDVLKSGIKTFKNGFCDVVVVEVLMEKTFYDVVKFMDDLNYDCYQLGRNTSLKGTEEMDWFVFNIVCIRRGCNRYKDIVNLIISST